jgi:hypothetical protein
MHPAMQYCDAFVASLSCTVTSNSKIKIQNSKVLTFYFSLLTSLNIVQNDKVSDTTKAQQRTKACNKKTLTA